MDTDHQLSDTDLQETEVNQLCSSVDSEVLTALSHLDLSAHFTFKKTRVVSVGGYGDISKGYCKMLNGKRTEVAVKRLRLVGREDIKLLFEKEIYVWSKLKHDNILPLLGFAFDKVSGYPLLLSEWMPNGSAWAYVKEHRDCDVLRLIIGTAQGLAYLHQRHVVHSDIKSENILVSATGDALLCDFGCSRMIAASLSLANLTQGVKGTFRHLAYELIVDDEESTGHSLQSDVWAFGMTILELLSHQRPYHEFQQDAQVIGAIMKSKMPKFPLPESLSISPDSFGGLENICLSCWTKDARTRPRISIILDNLLSGTREHVWKKAADLVWLEGELKQKEEEERLAKEAEEKERLRKEEEEVEKPTMEIRWKKKVKAKGGRPSPMVSSSSQGSPGPMDNKRTRSERGDSTHNDSNCISASASQFNAAMSLEPVAPLEASANRWVAGGTSKLPARSPATTLAGESEYASESEPGNESLTRRARSISSMATRGDSSEYSDHEDADTTMLDIRERGRVTESEMDLILRLELARRNGQQHGKTASRISLDSPFEEVILYEEEPPPPATRPTSRASRSAYSSIDFDHDDPNLRSSSPHRSITPTPVEPNSPAVVHRKVLSLLKILTMENFESISNQIISWANKSESEKDGRTLIQVTRLVFKKATDEAAWSEMYARLCRKMMEQISPNVQDDDIRNAKGKPITGGLLFRKYLLNRCQEDFERGWTQKESTAAAALAKATEDQALKDASDKEENKEGSALYSDEYYAAQKAKRQGLGLVKFIGELFKLQMLTERIMHECIEKLLNNVENPEEEIESLCMLLSTVGQALDTPKARGHMDVYFSRMKELAKSNNVSSHKQFMLQDVIELRERKWVPRNVIIDH